MQTLMKFLSASTFLLFSAIAVADTPDTSSWVCEYCPFDDGYRADYDAGVSYVSDDAVRFGDANGYDEKGAYLNLDGEGSFASEDYRANWTIEDLGLDSRYVSFSGGKPASYDYYFDYRQLPAHRFDTTSTIFGQTSADALSLPSGWVRAPLTSGFSTLDASLISRNISSERRMFSIGGKYIASEALQMTLDYRHREKDGLRITAGSYFTSSSLLPAPIDYVTDEAEIELRYAGDHGFVSLTYFASSFSNDNPALRWETPFTSAPGAEIGALAQAPDNSFQQVSAAGNYRFSSFDTVLGFSAASGRIEQDELFLPYTSNALLSPPALPRDRLNGEVETTNIAVTLTSRPFDKARVRFGYRLDDRDNLTPVDTYERVIVDSFNSGETETNTPYSFRKTRLGVSASYQLLPSVKLSAGYDRNEHDRDFQEVAEQTEDEGWGMIRWRPNSYLDIRAKGGTAERDIDRYDETVATSLGQNPLLRKYNLAYRFRQFGELTVAASLPEKPVSLTLSALYANDDYEQSRLGMIESDDLRIAGDVSFALADNRYFYLHGGYENIESEQLGSEQFSTADWTAQNTDAFFTAGGGLHLQEIAENIDLKIDYTRTEGETEISVNTLASGQSRFPDLESTMDSLRVRLNWRRSEKLGINFGIRYERFEVEDWALEGVAPDTIPVVLTLGAEPYDYDVFVVGVGFTYSLEP